MAQEVAEFAYDLHAGLSSYVIPEFDQLHTIGMAATLAIHIKGLGDINYEVLRKVSDHFMSIPSIALKSVLEVLAEVEFVRINSTGKTINSITPNIPTFQNVYDGIGEYTKNECTLNIHEEATLKILSELYSSPRNRDSLFNKSGIDKKVFDRCITLGSQSGIVNVQKARGKEIVISPYYFADNLDGLADIVASAGSQSLLSALNKVKSNQGWPISVIAATGEIGGSKLSPVEVALIRKLAEEGVVKPPTIKFGGTQESFLFTPKPGKTRLNAANREIYERSMALISAVRKGQLLPNKFRIHSPVRLLEVLRDNGYIKANSEAKDQYQNLVFLRVGSLKPISSSFWQFHLTRTEENLAAINSAISMLRTGALANMEVSQDARIALAKDEQYIQSLIASSEMKKRQKQIENEHAEHEYQQLLMKLD